MEFTSERFQSLETHWKFNKATLKKKTLNNKEHYKNCMLEWVCKRMERKERGEKDGEGGDVWKERENYGWGEKNSLAVWVKENVFVFLPPHPASRVEIGESVLQEVFKLFFI